MTWKPSVSQSVLEARAQLLANIRSFFAERGVMEVETPLLGLSSATDPYIDSMTASTNQYLQTSPEYAMKRLLANGSGPIYQICKAFRAGEQGKRHHPEFTLLEWYRPGWNHHQLIDEVDTLLQTVLRTKPAEIITYQNVFKHYLNFDPLTDEADIRIFFKKNTQHTELLNNIEAKNCLMLLMSEHIEPHLGKDRPCIIVDYPADQAALAKINGAIAERFECYVQGMELANGYHELTDPDEFIRRYIADIKQRQVLNKPLIPIDNMLVDAKRQGLPDCAGVALGLDRLLISLLNIQDIRELLAQ